METWKNIRLSEEEESTIVQIEDPEETTLTEKENVHYLSCPDIEGDLEDGELDNLPYGEWLRAPPIRPSMVSKPGIQGVQRRIKLQPTRVDADNLITKDPEVIKNNSTLQPVQNPDVESIQKIMEKVGLNQQISPSLVKDGGTNEAWQDDERFASCIVRSWSRGDATCAQKINATKEALVLLAKEIGSHTKNMRQLEKKL
ncbi:hypothetical protein SESBI_35535 [Sesbania bispinosa]|nr:hypothetical protein SESBI_35535 [Sesbania bispinosa]